MHTLPHLCHDEAHIFAGRALHPHVVGALKRRAPRRQRRVVHPEQLHSPALELHSHRCDPYARCRSTAAAATASSSTASHHHLLPGTTATSATAHSHGTTTTCRLLLHAGRWEDHTGRRCHSWRWGQATSTATVAWER